MLFLSVFGQADTGFTNKHEAKNIMLNGAKEGKWIENVPFLAGYYTLSIYIAGKACGIVRQYYPDGKLYLESNYDDGKKNGLEKRYNEAGQLQAITPFVNDLRNGIEKVYYASKDYKAIIYANGKTTEVNDDSLTGKLVMETPYVNGKINGVMKQYYFDGTVEFETTYTNNIQGATKAYPKKGK